MKRFDPKSLRPTFEAAGRFAARRAPATLFVVAILGTLGLCFGAGAWFTLRWAVQVPDIALPDLSRLDREVAEDRLRELGLVPVHGGARFDAELPQGKVLEHFPPPGTRTRPGRSVRLIFSEGAERALVPELTGSSLRRARLALRGAGLKVGLTSAVSHPEIGLGRVVAQNPPAGTEAYPGDTVTLLVSEGPPDRGLVMPSLVGLAVDVARGRLSGAGIRRIEVDAPNGRGRSAQRVVGQRPLPGERLHRDDRVRLLVGPRLLGQEDR